MRYSWNQQTSSVTQRSSTGVHDAPQVAPKHAWGAPPRKVPQGCITNLAHWTDTFYKNFLLAKKNINQPMTFRI